MQNLLILVRGQNGEDRTEFTRRMMSEASDGLLALHPACLKVNLTENNPPKRSVIPFRRDLIALFSFTGKSLPDDALLAKIPGFYGAYTAERAVPVAYEVSWCEGEGTPGCGLLTLFRKRPDLDYETFLNRWHNGHTPLSLQIHPLWNYVRNVVTSVHTEGSPWYDGIVEEHFQCGEDLLKPVRFFGGFFPMLVNMLRVLTDVKSFIDYGSIESYFTKEYHIKID